MNGIVDDDLRALLEVEIGAVPGGAKSAMKVWIDTAFKWRVGAASKRDLTAGADGVFFDASDSCGRQQVRIA